MGSTKNISKKEVSSPATNPEDRENQMIALAESLAEKQLREGTASSQIIAHYLKLGSSKYELEKQKLAYETEMVQAKTENLKAAKHVEELYAEALKYMKRYSGISEEDSDDDYDEEDEDDY